MPYVASKGFVDSVEEQDVIPVRIGEEMNEKQVKEIQAFLIEKRPLDAQSLGLIGIDVEKIQLTPDLIVDKKDIVDAIEKTKDKPKTKKKGPGRPKKVK